LESVLIIRGKPIGRHGFLPESAYRFKKHTQVGIWKKNPTRTQWTLPFNQNEEIGENAAMSITAKGKNAKGGMPCASRLWYCRKGRIKTSSLMAEILKYSGSQK
jgi:hypothetical protein